MIGSTYSSQRSQGASASPEVLAKVKDVKERYEEAILALPGVVGVRIGSLVPGNGKSGGIGLVIYVERARDQRTLQNLMRDRLEGVGITFQVTGRVRLSIN